MFNNQTILCILVTILCVSCDLKTSARQEGVTVIRNHFKLKDNSLTVDYTAEPISKSFSDCAGGKGWEVSIYLLFQTAPTPYQCIFPVDLCEGENDVDPDKATARAENSFNNLTTCDFSEVRKQLLKLVI